MNIRYFVSTRNYKLLLLLGLYFPYTDLYNCAVICSKRGLFGLTTLHIFGQQKGTWT